MSGSEPKAGGKPGAPVAAVVLVAMLGVLAYAVWGFQALWRMGGDTPMTIHGWIAMGLAFVLTGALAGGLMWLAFYSARKGYDDEAGKEDG